MKKIIILGIVAVVAFLIWQKQQPDGVLSINPIDISGGQT